MLAKSDYIGSDHRFYVSDGAVLKVDNYTKKAELLLGIGALVEPFGRVDMISLLVTRKNVELAISIGDSFAVFPLSISGVDASSFLMQDALGSRSDVFTLSSECEGIAYNQYFFCFVPNTLNGTLLKKLIS